MRVRSGRALLVTFLGLSTVGSFAACGASSSSDANDGDSGGGTSGSAMGGASGAGGTAGASTGGTSAGGSSGTGGSGTSGASTGGNAGTAPSGGSAGTEPLGGTGGNGAGGAAQGGQECQTNDDCFMYSDCCSCTAVPKDANVPGCDRECITDHCTSQQIGLDEAACRNGRCVINRSCNGARITCLIDPAACPAGLVHSVDQNNCYGPCLPPTDCRDVTNCSICSNTVCVSNDADSTLACVVPPDGCTKENYCECLGTCSESFLECVETEDVVHCACPTC